LDIEYIDLYLMHWPMARAGSKDGAGSAIIGAHALTNEIAIGKVCQPDESPTFVETWLGMEKLLERG
jgi:glycerol 2-dehydrogenase (NADP+)